MQYEKRDELSAGAAERVYLSACEHTWTQDEQFEMARHLLKCQRIIKSLVSGISELAESGYGVRDEVREILVNSEINEYYLFRVSHNQSH